MDPMTLFPHSSAYVEDSTYCTLNSKWHCIPKINSIPSQYLGRMATQAIENSPRRQPPPQDTEIDQNNSTHNQWLLHLTHGVHITQLDQSRKRRQSRQTKFSQNAPTRQFYPNAEITPDPHSMRHRTDIQQQSQLETDILPCLSWH